MRFLRLMGWFACLTCVIRAGQPEFYLKDGDTVVFYGDSITDRRLYTAYTEAFVLTRFPQLRVNFIHSGWAGDRVTGGFGGPIDVRLQRDVIAYQPTVLTIMLGMNDGGYQAFDPKLFHTFATGYESLIAAVRKTLPKTRITAIQPSPYDDVTRAPQFEGGYNSVLVRYGSFVRELARRESLNIADGNTEIVAALKTANKRDPALAQKIIPDRVHPGEAGNLLIAEALLKSWNAPAIVTAVELDASMGTLSRSENTKVTGVRNQGGLSWTQLDRGLPMAIDWKDPVTNLAVHSSDLLRSINEESLRIVNLSPGAYALKIDGESIGNFAAGQLASAINLAEFDTPMSKQSANVLLRTHHHNHIHFARWRLIQTPLDEYGFKNTHAAMDTLDALEREVVAGQRAAAQPKEHRYELTRVDR